MEQNDFRGLPKNADFSTLEKGQSSCHKKNNWTAHRKGRQAATYLYLTVSTYDFLSSAAATKADSLDDKYLPIAFNNSLRSIGLAK